MKNYPSIFLMLLIAVVMVSSCKSKSPENLPKYKKAFRTQIASFETQKDKTDKKVAQGVQDLSGIQAAIQNAKNVDKEFNQVYTRWKKVDKQVDDLSKEYKKLKGDADNLFEAMTKQTEGLSDVKTRSELSNAISKTRSDYSITLQKTERSINKLKTLHADAVDVIKALEVAVALGQISEINSGLQGIENKVAAVMAELNTSIAESKDLYNKRIGSYN